MAAHPRFGRDVETPDTSSAEGFQPYECAMCHGTGRVLNTIPNLRAGHRRGAGGASLDSRRSLDSIVVSLASYGMSSQRAGFPRYVIRRIEELVGERLEGRVGVTELSHRLGYSPSHFSRMFRRSFGITPHTYVMRRRVAVAQKLLTRTDLGLVDIALKAGFCDQSHLSRNFRRYAGVPPRAYRAIHRVFPDGDATVAATE
jgi:AraC-like DNA-binding protein